MFVDCMAIPKEVYTAFPCPFKVRFGFWVLVRVTNHSSVPSVFLDDLCHCLCWASHSIRKSQCLFVVNPIKMVITEIHDHPRAPSLGSRHLHKFIGLRFGKYEGIGSKVVEACPPIADDLGSVPPTSGVFVTPMDK